MGELTVNDIIANDMARKCADDVSGAILRTFRLSDSQGACVCAAASASGVSIGILAGAMWASRADQIGEDALDALWRDLLKPLAMGVVGDRKPFEAMLAEISAKRERINP